MTERVLLEPLTGCGWRGPLSDGPPDGPARLADPECPWAVRVTGWEAARDALLPAGLVVVSDPPLRHAAGRLTGAQLTAWSRSLAEAGAVDLAEKLSATLDAHQAPAPVWAWGGARSWRLDFSRPLVMGIVNVTPDSFSGDGLAGDVEGAVRQGLEMAAAGADLLDVGGESTRPGAEPVSEASESARVLPVVRALSRRLPIPVGVDSSKPGVMRAALEAGAACLNDVTALAGADGARTARMLAEHDIPLVLMHMQNSPATMQRDPSYRHVVSEVYDFLAERIAFCLAHGMRRDRLIADPGIGFGKTTEHNLALLRRSRLFRGLGVPLLLGLSRKRVVGALTGVADPRGRDAGSHLLGALAGADILRVHDVAGARQALAVAAGFTRSHLEAAA